MSQSKFLQDWQERVENNNKDRTLIKLEWIQKEVR